MAICTARTSRRLVAGLILFASFAPGAALGLPPVGEVLWQQQFNPAETSRKNARLFAVGFLPDGAVLTSGTRSEPDSASAIGLRLDRATGSILDSPPEWYLFEDTYFDYAQDRFTDLIIMPNGELFFAGLSYAADWNSFSSRFNVPNVWKYSSTYNNPPGSSPDRPLWRQYYSRAGAAANNAGQFNGLSMDAAGNLVAVGYYTKLDSTTSSRDWIIDKYDSDGNRAPGFPIALDHMGLDDYAYDVVTDSESNFVVAGSVLVDADTNHHDWVVRKYSSDGSLLWHHQYDWAGEHDQALKLAVDANDDIIVSGYRREDQTNDDDWYLVKYAAAGDGVGGPDVLWEQAWDDGNGKPGIGRDVVMEKSGNFYVVGRQQEDSSDPLFENRYRPVLQFRDGETGDLLRMQKIELDPTPNDRPDVEHDYLVSMALEDGYLVIAGYTVQDGGFQVIRGRTARIVMVSVKNIFSDRFEASDGLD